MRSASPIVSLSLANTSVLHVSLTSETVSSPINSCFLISNLQNLSSISDRDCFVPGRGAGAALSGASPSVIWDEGVSRP